jgi:hypothetical protein
MLPEASGIKAERPRLDTRRGATPREPDGGTPTQSLTTQSTETAASHPEWRLAASGHTLVTPVLLPVILASQVLELVGRVGIEPTTN